jgi:hypothetical protein
MVTAEEIGQVAVFAVKDRLTTAPCPLYVLSLN